MPACQGCISEMAKVTVSGTSIQKRQRNKSEWELWADFASRIYYAHAVTSSDSDAKASKNLTTDPDVLAQEIVEDLETSLEF